MPCHYCRAGEMHPGETTVTLERHGVTITIRHIPAQICAACGEATFDAATSEKILALADALMTVGLSGVTVEVSGKAA
jgi:YgiT-type zinc finger domain-containing protein